MDEKELKEWLTKTKSELTKLEISEHTVHFGLIQGAILMIELVMNKLNIKN